MSREAGSGAPPDRRWHAGGSGTLLLDEHFTPILADLICAEVSLDLASLDLADSTLAVPGGRRRERRRGFTEEVLRAYAYQPPAFSVTGDLGRWRFSVSL